MTKDRDNRVGHNSEAAQSDQGVKHDTSRFNISTLNGTDLTKIVYPICIFITGWHIIPNLYDLSTTWQGDIAFLQSFYLRVVLYTVVFALIPLAFGYLFFKGVRLKFKWSGLAAASTLMIIVFAYEGISLFSNPSVGLTQKFLRSWDHTFFPIAFGFFFLCDLNKLPKKFWLFLSPLATMAILTNSNMIANIFFDRWAIFHGAPGFYSFFGDVRNMSEVLALPEQRLIHGLIEYLHEQLTFLTLFPIVIVYYLAKVIKNERSKAFNTAVVMVITTVWMLVISGSNISPDGKVIIYLFSFVFLGSWLLYYLLRKEKKQAQEATAEKESYTQAIQTAEGQQTRVSWSEMTGSLLKAAQLLQRSPSVDNWFRELWRLHPQGKVRWPL